MRAVHGSSAASKPTAAGARATTATSGRRSRVAELRSTPYQTAWALLALMAGPATDAIDVLRRGIDYLLRTQQADGLWSDPSFTAPGFPRVFYLQLPRLRLLFPAMGAGALSAPQAARIIGVIAALSSEARCLGRSRRRADESVRLDDGTLVRVSGIGPEAAEEAAEALVRSGATALLSWGVAGGLDPVLCSGTVLLASEVRANGSDAEPPWARCFSTSVAWRERLQQRLGPSALQGALLSGRELIATPAHKAQLFALTAARAVDMESAAIAAVARCHELPFMAVRAIVDGACDALPAALADRLREGGSWAPLLAVPPLWPSLLRLGVRYRRARSALRSCARRGITP